MPKYHHSRFLTTLSSYYKSTPRHRRVFARKFDGVFFLIMLCCVLGLWYEQLSAAWVPGAILDPATGFVKTGPAVSETVKSHEVTLANVYVGSDLVLSLRLNDLEPQIIQVPQRPEVELEIHTDHSISFYASTCKDQLCVLHRPMYAVGESMACLPRQVLVKLVAATMEADEETLATKAQGER